MSIRISKLERSAALKVAASNLDVVPGMDIICVYEYGISGSDRSVLSLTFSSGQLADLRHERHEDAAIVLRTPRAQFVGDLWPRQGTSLVSEMQVVFETRWGMFSLAPPPLTHLHASLTVPDLNFQHIDCADVLLQLKLADSYAGELSCFVQFVAGRVATLGVGTVANPSITIVAPYLVGLQYLMGTMTIPDVLDRGIVVGDTVLLSVLQGLLFDDDNARCIEIAQPVLRYSAALARLVARPKFRAFVEMLDA